MCSKGTRRGPLPRSTGCVAFLALHPSVFSWAQSLQIRNLQGTGKLLHHTAQSVEWQLEMPQSCRLQVAVLL